MTPNRKIVMVTGAGAGAGRAIAARFGREGWRVALLSRDPDRLVAAKSEIEASGGEALAIPTDVADAAAVFAARDRVIEAWGSIDAWINCAMATIVGTVDDLEIADFKRVVDVTLMGYVHGTKAALEVMRAADHGAIVQVGSALAYRAIPLQSAYCTCKFAIRGFTDSLRAELIHEKSKITVSMLQMPGMNTIQFDWAKNLFADKYQPVGDVFDPDVAAEAAWRAVRDGPRELWVGGSAIEAIVGQLAFPPYLDRVVGKQGFDKQISHIPDPPRPDNLYAAVAADVGARGRFAEGQAIGTDRRPDPSPGCGQHCVPCLARRGVCGRIGAGTPRMTPNLTQLQADPGTITRRDEHPATQRATFMIATGLECSYPTVEGGKRRDELESTGHYTHWREDFELCVDIGARHVRYGIPYYKSHMARGKYDWSFADEVLPAMWDKGLIPIVDLCHFGVPDWVGGFQNTDWPPHFAEYCAAFATRYPWIKYYTPVNEIIVCARFSALSGDWNEQEKSDRAFVMAHANQCRAAILGMLAILKHRPDAVFIQSEVAEANVELSPAGQDAARFANELRFITFDHIYGRAPQGQIAAFLLDNGLTRDDLHWFVEHGGQTANHCVLGMDYYSGNERVVHDDGSKENEGVMLGWHAIARDYYARYDRPLMLTETNMVDDGSGQSEHWLRQTWAQAHHLRTHGVPMVGYTWYSLTDQIDWGIQLRRIENKVTPNGLCTLERKLRPVGEAYKKLARRNAGSPLIDGVPNGLLSL